MRLEFHPEADAEYGEILEYLASDSVISAEKFDDSLHVALLRIKQRPAGGRPTFRGCRLMEVRGFPHRIIYKELADALWILAVAHTRRRPGYWTARMS